MSFNHEELQKRLQSYQELQAKREKVQEQIDQIARARAQGRRAHSTSEDHSEDLGTGREISSSQEGYDSSDDTGEDMGYTAPPPSIVETPRSGPAAPSEETLRRFATTVAYSSYSRLCGTSDDTLIRNLIDDELRKEPAAVLGPKKMIEIPQGEHNVAFLRQELAEGAASPFAASMAEVRRQIDPEVTIDHQVRRLGPAEILDDSLPIYWIVTFSKQGMLDWEGGCSLARVYHGVFKEYGAEDVHCLVLDHETDLSCEDRQKAFALE